VYIDIRGGKGVYTGNTNDLERRALEHGAKGRMFDDLAQVAKELVTRAEARAIEQALIERNRGLFENIRNSISPDHGIMSELCSGANLWLRLHGY
jgi:hypothetical protein